MKTLGAIAGITITEYDDGRVQFIGPAHIDCDGSGGNPHGDPCFQPDTTLHNLGAPLNAERVPYIVVPPLVIKGVRGVVMGCQARVTHTHTGRSVMAVVGDIGPRRKIGELSPAAAEAIGLNGNPNHGGEDAPVIKYELWPGVAAVAAGVSYQLQPA